jgi:hypothetical protein
LQFKVRVEPLGWEVIRKNTDFYFLRKTLLKLHPYLIIPPLPMNKKKETQKFIKRREMFFSRFMQALSRSEELKSDLFLVDWLQNNDSKKF